MENIISAMQYLEVLAISKEQPISQECYKQHQKWSMALASLRKRDRDHLSTT